MTDALAELVLKRAFASASRDQQLWLLRVYQVLVTCCTPDVAIGLLVWFGQEMLDHDPEKPLFLCLSAHDTAWLGSQTPSKLADAVNTMTWRLVSRPANVIVGTTIALRQID